MNADTCGSELTDRILIRKREGAAKRSPNLNVFSVQPLRALCLCGEEVATNVHLRNTEDTEIAQRKPRTAPTALPIIPDPRVFAFICGS